MDHTRRIIQGDRTPGNSLPRMHSPICYDNHRPTFQVIQTDHRSSRQIPLARRNSRRAVEVLKNLASNGSAVSESRDLRPAITHPVLSFFPYLPPYHSRREHT